MAHQPKQPVPCISCDAPKAWARKLCKRCYYREYAKGTHKNFGKLTMAHRVSYEHFKGPIPEGMVVMHSCDNPSCVNPEHLSVGSKTDNNRDAVKKNRHAHGEKNGHAKLTVEQVRMIKESAYTCTQAELAKSLGVHQSAISKIKAGKRWVRA